MLAASWMSTEPGTLPLPLSLGAKVAGLVPRLVLGFLTRNPSTFIETGGRLVNEKLHSQWLELKDLREKRAELGRRGGLAKARNLLEQNPSPAFAFALAKSKAKTPLPPAIAGEVQLVNWRGNLIEIQMGRHRRVPDFTRFAGLHPMYVNQVLGFLRQRGFPARILQAQ